MNEFITVNVSATKILFLQFVWRNKWYLALNTSVYLYFIVAQQKQCKWKYVFYDLNHTKINTPICKWQINFTIPLLPTVWKMCA